MTEGIRTTLVETKQVPPEKVLFLPNGADTGMFNWVPEEAELAQELGLQGQRVILYAGTLGLFQGLDVAIEATDGATLSGYTLIGIKPYILSGSFE